MNFFALVTDYDEDEEIIHASILDPRCLRNKVINFHSSIVQREETWQRPLIGKTSLLIGEYRQGGEVTNVNILPTQQFRGVIQDWDPVSMQASVRYPEIGESHQHNFNNPWLSRGDRVIVEGSFSGLEWSVADFRLHRRVRTCRLEVGTIADLSGDYGSVTVSLNEELDFGVQDVLLCDCRDFYPGSLQLIGYTADLRNTFEVGDQVFFIRAQDENLERCVIKVFVPGTEFGILDPIFDSTSSDLCLSSTRRAGSLKSSGRNSSDQIEGEEASLSYGLRQRSRMNLRESSIMKSCPDINACFFR